MELLGGGGIWGCAAGATPPLGCSLAEVKESKLLYNMYMAKIPRPVFFLGLVSFFNDVAAEMIYPIVPIFLTSVLHAPMSIVGLIEGIAEGTASLGKFIFGYFSDKIHKRKIFVVAGYGLDSATKLLLGLAFSWPLVFLARFLSRLGKGVRTAARDSILLQNTTAQNRGFIFGFHRAFDSAGAVFGPIAALLLMQLLKEDVRSIFFIAFIPSLIGVVLLVLFVRERTQDTSDGVLSLSKDSSGVEESENSPISPISPIRPIACHSFHPSLKLFFFISIIFALGNSSDAFLILRSKDLGLSTSLVIFTYMLYNLSQTIFATPAGSLADKIGARKVYALGLLVFAVVYFLFGVINNPFWLWLIFPVYGVYIAATDGVSKAYISEFITERQSGTYFGLYQTSISVAAFFASFIGGILWSKISPSATFFYGSFMSLAAFLILGYAKLVRKV
ncbi:MFS transporter [Candidatus Gottesmanbacteria bacterium]|nr:MFS transporter [Candidatus Gottesmanbacteria bacterium]